MNIQASAASLTTVGGIELSDQVTEMVIRASPSVAMLTAVTEADGKTHMNEGTSFCVDERGFFLTAFHYVMGSSSSYIFLGAEVVPTTLVAVDEDLDLALFVVKKLDRLFVPLSLSTVPLGKDDLAIGVGYPAGQLSASLAAYVVGYQGQFVNGVDPNQPGIECPRLPTAAWFIGDGVELSGFSGGPMLSEDGLVVAVTEMGDGDVFVAGTTAADARQFLASHLR
jgi:S1-C subfamily serine protease